VSQPLELHTDTQLEESFSSAVEVLKNRIENFTHHASGWTIQGLIDASVNIAPYSPIKAGCSVKIPTKLILKKQSEVSRIAIKSVFYTVCWRTYIEKI